MTSGTDKTVSGPVARGAAARPAAIRAVSGQPVSHAATSHSTSGLPGAKAGRGGAVDSGHGGDTL